MVNQLQLSNRKVNKYFHARHAAFLHCREFPPVKDKKNIYFELLHKYADQQIKLQQRRFYQNISCLMFWN
jgi:hypothetical protein